jgi:hypothetical protein
MGIVALVFGSAMASANQRAQSGMWGRTFWTSARAIRCNAAKNKVVGIVAICAGFAVLQRSHRNTYAKIGTSSRAAAVMFAVQHGLLPEEKIATTAPA